MVLTYKKLWKLLRKRGLTRKELARQAGIHPITLTRIGHNSSINTDMLIKICQALKCDLSDICQLIPKEE